MRQGLATHPLKTRLLLLALLTAGLLITIQSLAAQDIEGKVLFYNIANSKFDQYSRNPTPIEQAWMRSHYYRQQTYKGYFDSRLAWYPQRLGIQGFLCDQAVLGYLPRSSRLGAARCRWQPALYSLGLFGRYLPAIRRRFR